MAQATENHSTSSETGRQPYSIPSALAVIDITLSRMDRVNMALDALALVADKSNRADLGAALAILSDELSSAIEQGREAWLDGRSAASLQ